MSLLKKTKEYGEQAKYIEAEYEKMYEQGEADYNLSNSQKFIEVANKIQIPMLDLSIIHVQQQEGQGDSSSTSNQPGGGAHQMEGQEGEGEEDDSALPSSSV